MLLLVKLLAYSLIIKGKSGFTSNTLLIRNSVCKYCSLFISQRLEGNCESKSFFYISGFWRPLLLLSKSILYLVLRRENQFAIPLTESLPRSAIANKRFSSCYKLARHWRQYLHYLNELVKLTPYQLVAGSEYIQLKPPWIIFYVVYVGMTLL